MPTSHTAYEVRNARGVTIRTCNTADAAHRFARAEAADRGRLEVHKVTVWSTSALLGLYSPDDCPRPVRDPLAWRDGVRVGP